ncbi:TMEM165/GDT1 family protein [Vogesella sp. XCS3]|jgi:putative Ca2+/H+ antiporter (TMEM165/GDT1 family)|uniref:TMEM165/GDT1 family protein n=1 Tax=Vogesella sp. XCS3 TaxID=2877939 RepID=UPI001B3DA1AC|nr:TMEM165/GDT1 family protein [Vogesella sp. XCS3]MBP7579831.1 TMEM165/GDT1 family protein [Vogesella sp.]UDM18518.1 TMEM165/GDT1 family protein [Vogesella sp. XCS3]
MEAFFLSTGIVALAEIGDKTQLLALLLAARFKKPVPIILGIFVATVFNHAAAAWLGHVATGFVDMNILRWVLGISFIAMAVWMLIPDKLDDETNLFERFGVFGATCIAFFLAEMGDKTQIATVALSARYMDATIGVVMGTTMGMMIANVPAVLLGEVAARKLPVELVHKIAAGIFAVVGVLTLVSF